MLITLSEKQNEKILCEWSNEITDQHAQDFCDVCNSVFENHYDLDYMRSQYNENKFGKSFIVIVYKDDKPVATWGAWRYDFCGKIIFQLCNFVTLPSVRKNGYILDMFNCISDNVRKIAPNAITFGFPASMAWPVKKALGCTVKTLYAHLYHGKTKDFLKEVPIIEDSYVEEFYTKRARGTGGVYRVFFRKIGGSYYLFLKTKTQYFLPSYLFLGQINSAYTSQLQEMRGPAVLWYLSHERGLLGERHMTHTSILSYGSEKDVENIPLPIYRKNTFSINFNRKNKN